MPANQETVDEVLGAMGEIVARDGGALDLLSYAPGDPTVKVRFRSGPENEDCATCEITADMLSAFLLEGFRSHGLEVDTVDVVEVN